MPERILIAIALIGLGVLAYRLLLSAQRRRASSATGHGRMTGRPALIVFTSPTCAPCKLQQMPVVDRLMAGWAERIDLRVVAADDDRAGRRRPGVGHQSRHGERAEIARAVRAGQRMGNGSTNGRAGEPTGPLANQLPRLMSKLLEADCQVRVGGVCTQNMSGGSPPAPARAANREDAVWRAL